MNITSTAYERTETKQKVSTKQKLIGDGIKSTSLDFSEFLLLFLDYRHVISYHMFIQGIMCSRLMILFISYIYINA